MSALAATLARRIAAEGPLSVAAYMETVTGDYYARRDPLGIAGDFITAPEVSQVFGELVGLWCGDFWQRWGAPAPVVLAELGPGRGTLMADALRALRVVPGFAAAARLHLVEHSPALRAAQNRALAAAAPQWHDAAAALPPGPLLLVANEFLDALPIRQFERGPAGWHERRIGVGRDGALRFTRDAHPVDLGAGAPADAPPGAVFETRPRALELAATLGARLGTAGGAALFIDYGHAASACGDTLQAVRRHASHPVLATPGEADLTAHVDFAAFAAAARAAGARAWGPVPQGRFLGALGIETRLAALRATAAPEAVARLDAACRRLTDPAAMGALFKVMALTHPGAPAPAGFAP